MQKDVVKNMEDASTGLLTSIFKSEKSIDSQLPIVFKSGYKLEEFNTKCHCCSANLKGNQFKGSIFKVAKNSRFECWSVDRIDNNQTEDKNVEKVMIDAVGFCPQCNVYTPCQVHVEDKGLSQDEAEAREKMLSEKHKNLKNKSFLGLSIQRMNNVKSQRSRSSITDKKIHDAALNNLGVDTGKKIEVTKLNKVAKEGVGKLLVDNTVSNSIKKTEFLKQSSTVKKSLIENRIDKILSQEDNQIGKSDNITDINAIARHNLQQATHINSKAVEAYQIGAMLSQPVIASPVAPNKSALKDNVTASTVEVSTTNNATVPKLAFLNRNNSQSYAIEPEIQSIASKKLHSVMDDNITNTISLTRKSYEEKIVSTDSIASNINVDSSIKDSSSVFLRGQRKSESQEDHIEPAFDNEGSIAPNLSSEVLRRDSRGVRGNSTSVAAKIEPKKTYVQSSGSIFERVTQSVMGLFSFLSNGYQKIQKLKENKKNNILNGHTYKAEKSEGRESARNRLESLKNNHEFERPLTSKVKVKKHNHDSFR